MERHSGNRKQGQHAHNPDRRRMSTAGVGASDGTRNGEVVRMQQSSHIFTFVGSDQKIDIFDPFAAKIRNSRDTRQTPTLLCLSIYPYLTIERHTVGI